MNWKLRAVMFTMFSIAGIQALAQEAPISMALKNKTTSGGNLSSLASEDSRRLSIYSNGQGKVKVMFYYKALKDKNSRGVFRVNANLSGVNKYKFKIQKSNKTWEQIEDFAKIDSGGIIEASLETKQDLGKYFVNSKGQYVVMLTASKGSDDIFIDEMSLVSASGEYVEQPPVEEPVEQPPVEQPPVEQPGNGGSQSGGIVQGMSFYWQLQGNITTNVNADVFDIDLEDNENNGVIRNLQNKGKKVICYFSAGTYENWRSDAGEFSSSDLGSPLDEWPGERWLDINSENVRRILKKRLDRAVAAGCDAVEPDNVDGYQNKNGLKLTATQQISFLKWLSAEAHARNLSIGLKNSLDIIQQGKLHEHFDWALNEQCYQYKECDALLPFSEAGKPVFIAEYKSFSEKNCTDAKNKDFFMALFNYDLNSKVYKTCE